MNIQKFLPELINIAEHAGKITLQYYQQDNMDVAHKDDNSPVTMADKSAHEYIVAALNKLDNTIPVLSEESADIAWETRKDWALYWLCDPLDGTREFIQGKPEFTVNIALIQNHQPIVGIICAPALGTVYYATKNQGAYEKVANGLPEPIQIQREKMPLNWRVLGSHSRNDAIGEKFLQRLGEYTFYPMGSALKFCWIASGRYDIYPRFVPSMEWDTAAGQCIVEEAGGKIITISGETLEYNRQQSLKNPSFIACALNDHFENEAS